MSVTFLDSRSRPNVPFNIKETSGVLGVDFIPTNLFFLSPEERKKG